MAQDGDPNTILSKFLEWVRKHGGHRMLYRGIAGKTRPASAAIARRLQKDDKNEDEFIRANRELIETAKMRGHDARKNLQRDLDILAELQHYGAATCLIDFTRNPFVGLWFACQNPSFVSGKVLAIDPGNYDRFVKINTNSMEESIGDLLPSRRRTGKLWVWEPKHQNERIIAQQSVFVFGDAEIQPDHVFIVENTEGILNELQKYGVSLESLFCDFDGFARANESAQQFRAENYLDKATDGHVQEKYKDAIEYYDRALKDVEEKSVHYYHRGRAKASLGATADKVEADAYYKQAIEDYNKSPDSEKMFFRRGNAKGRLGNYKCAITDYDRAIEINPQLVEAHYNRGLSKGKSGDLSGAMADFAREIEINPQFANAYYNRGVAKEQSGDIPGAMADYNRAIEINPQLAEAHYNRGLSKGKSGELSGAIADFDRAIEINPQHSDAYNNRGLAKKESGDLPGAMADYDKAIEINPQYAAAYNNRGLAKHELSNYKGAIADYDRAIEINPQLAEAHYNRSIAKEESGDSSGAIADYDRAIEINPRFASAYNNRGLIREKSGDYKSAIADYDRAIEINPQLAAAYNNRAIAKEKSGDMPGAIADFDRAIEINKQYVAAYHNRAITKRQLGDKEGAAADFRKAEELKNSPQP